MTDTLTLKDRLGIADNSNSALGGQALLACDADSQQAKVNLEHTTSADPDTAVQSEEKVGSAFHLSFNS